MTDISRLREIEDKLHRALKSKAVLAERSKQLAQQVDDARAREDQTSHLMSELVERQRELNFMLHRANSVLQRMQEANAALSTEFTELVKELPQPEAPDWEQRVSKINDLFKKTGAMADEVEDQIFGKGLGAEDIRRPTEPTPAKSASETVAEASLPEPVVVKAVVEDEPATEPVEVISDEDDETIIEAEVVEQSPILPEETQPEATTDVAEYEEEQKQREEKLDRLFRALDEDEDRATDAGEPDGSATSEHPGVMSRVWQKLKGRRQAAAQPQSEPADEAPADDSSETHQSDDSKKPGPRPPSSDLWDEASELDLIRMDIIPPNAEAVPPLVSDERSSSWLQPKHRKNLNRRVNPPQPGQEAHGHA